jgi:hypothetical protein
MVKVADDAEHDALAAGAFRADGRQCGSNVDCEVVAKVNLRFARISLVIGLLIE